MQYIHVKNLEKYHPGYKDRDLKWAKIYFQMVQGDPDCELIDDEIDWGRYVKLILLELQAKKAIPLDNKYLTKKGFNLKKRPMSLTLKMLQNFVTVVTEDSTLCNLDKDKDKDKDKEEDKERDTVTKYQTTDLEKRMTEFELEVMLYKGEYPVEMLRAFWEYWSEPNKSKTKMKKELRETWDIKRRLNTWKQNQENFGGKNGRSKTTGATADELAELATRRAIEQGEHIPEGED